MARPTDDASPWQAIQRNPIFQTLVERRGRFATRLSLIMMALYFTFILLIAFAPGVLGMPLGSETVITLGIPIGLGLIVVAIVLTGIYVRRANGEFDRLTAEVLDDVKKQRIGGGHGD